MGTSLFILLSKLPRHCADGNAQFQEERMIRAVWFLGGIVAGILGLGTAACLSSFSSSPRDEEKETSGTTKIGVTVTVCGV